MTQASDLSHVIARLNNATQMVMQLPSFIEDDQLPPAVRLACVEDWYLNYRLLIEFLLMRPPSNCASPENFIPGWRSTNVERDRLQKDYGLASEDFAHIGNLKGRATPRAANADDMRSKAGLILAVVAEFSQALAHDNHPLAEVVGNSLDVAQRTLTA